MDEALVEALGQVEAFPRFLTVDEIDHSLAGLYRAAGGCDLDVIGRSRAGHPIRMLTTGRGTRHALVIAMPHPNEPTGALAAIRLAELLARRTDLRDGLGLVWHIVACADPDGTRLNESWFAGPVTTSSYAAGLYRPPFDEQFEWTFHRSDLEEPGLAATPESRAVMDVVDGVRPELLASLHNSEVGGMFCYVTDDAPDLVGDLGAIGALTGIRPDLGPPEEPTRAIGPGVFHVPANLVGGRQLCSTDYAGRYGTFGLTSEPPLWASDDVDDERLTGATRGDEWKQVADAREELSARHAAWVDVVAADVELAGSARGRAVRADAEMLQTAWPPTVDDADAGLPATIALRSSMWRGLGLERMRASGQVVALLREQPADRLGARTLDVLDDAERAMSLWSEVAAAGARLVGRDEAVRCHVGLVLAAGSRLRR